jgi:uncharacterized DUF497 family protein
MIWRDTLRLQRTYNVHTLVQKHGVSFHTTCEVFFDPFVRLLDALISAREATRDERRQYEDP